jgi:hypothetical protein
MTDVWAAAQGKPANTGQPAGESQIADSYEEQESQLFSGGEGAGPSIINKTHRVPSKRTGIIAKAPYDRHSTNVAGKLKFWQDGQNSPVLEPINPVTGQPNRKVMDTVLVLDTDYVMSAEEAKALGRETPYEGGRRSFTAGGENLKLLRKAIETYNANPANASRKITGGKSMMGLRFTIDRVAEKPNPNGGDTIKVHEIELSQP